ncbi:D-galactonate dehydratase [compost metagenome]
MNKDDFKMTDGHFYPLTKPGLGVEINEELVIERSKQATDWRNPVWRYPDGAVAEW